MTEKRINAADLQQLPSRYRANLCNSLPGFKSLVLVGTRSSAEVNNLAPFSQVIHIGSNPSLMAILFRPHTVRRDTLENILSEKQFTINHVQASFYEKAHQSAAKYEAHQSEFETVGLTPEFTEAVTAPYVQESSIKIGLEWVETMEIALNNTLLVIGKAVEIRVPTEIIKEDGYLDIEAANTITSSNLDAYHTTQKIDRLKYPQPDQPPTSLPKNLF